MDDQKEKFWKSWMTITVLLAVVVMVAWSNFQGPAVRPDEDVSIGNVAHVPIDNGTRAIIENGVNIQTTNGVHIPIGNRTRVITGNSTGAQTGTGVDTQADNVTALPMDDDTFFETWVMMSYKAINENLFCISKASGDQNLSSIEECGRRLRENTNISLRDIDKHGANFSRKIVVEEYKKALIFYNIGGMDLEIGAKSENVPQMNYAVENIKNGTVHVELVDKMLYGKTETNATG